jgi:chromosome segregation ATPase
MNIDDIIENAQLKGRIIALDAQVETLTAEVRCLEAVVRSHERVDCLTVANLKAEVERLESDLKLEKENEDRLVRLWQTANNEVHGQRSQIAALIDNQTSLKAEVERLQSIHSIDSIGIEQLKAEVERLTADLNKMIKTHEGVHYVEVDVGFWTKSGSRLPSSYRTFWSNDKGVQS